MIAGLTRRAVALLVAMFVLPLAVVFFLVRALMPGPAALAAPAPTASIQPTPPAPPTPKPAEDRTPEVLGTIFDADGNPVQGATVRLVSPSPPYKLLGDARSDGAGLFSFARVPPGAVRVDADHDPEGFVRSAELRAVLGQSTRVTLVLSATSGVRGTVVDGEQKPVAGVALSVEGVPWAVAGTTSDDAGAFHLTIVPEEATSLVAVARGYRTVHVAMAQREAQIGSTSELEVHIQLTRAPSVEGEVVGVDGEPVRAGVVACAGQPSEARTESGDDGAFQLPPSAIGCEAIAELAGNASSDPAVVEGGRRLRLRLKPGGTIEGVVIDDRGSGVPTFVLGIESYSSARSQSVEGGGPRTFEDRRGSFRWDKLAPGSYVLTASAPGKPPTRSDSIEVTSGAVTRGVRIVLARGGSVVGRVFDDRHEPLADVALSFDAVSSVVESNVAVRTDELGRYKLEGAPAGPFTLRAQKSGFRPLLISGLRVESGVTLTQDVTLMAGGGMELSGIGATLRGSSNGIELASVGESDPAGRAGLEKGDRVVSIDGESTVGMSVADAIQRLRGKVGTTVDVSVVRAGETLDVAIVRGTIVR